MSLSTSLQASLRDMYFASNWYATKIDHLYRDVTSAAPYEIAAAIRQWPQLLPVLFTRLGLDLPERQIPLSLKLIEAISLSDVDVRPALAYVPNIHLLVMRVFQHLLHVRDESMFISAVKTFPLSKQVLEGLFLKTSERGMNLAALSLSERGSSSVNLHQVAICGNTPLAHDILLRDFSRFFECTPDTNPPFISAAEMALRNGHLETAETMIEDVIQYWLSTYETPEEELVLYSILRGALFQSVELFDHYLTAFESYGFSMEAIDLTRLTHILENEFGEDSNRYWRAVQCLLNHRVPPIIQIGETTPQSG